MNVYIIHSCKVYQSVSLLIIKSIIELQPVSIPEEVVSQTGVDVINIPEAKGMKCIVIAI